MVSVVTLALLPVIGFTSGLALWMLIPLLSRPLPVLGGVSEKYMTDAARCYGSMLLVLRETGAMSFDLVSAEFNPERKTWEATLDGQTESFEDPHGYMSRWQKKRFGIADEKRGVIITPRVAEIGALVKSMREGRDQVSVEGDTFQEGIVGVAPDPTRLVDMTAARHVITGSSTATLPDRTEEFTKLSQRLWNSKPTVQHMIWLGAAGVGAGIPIIAAQLGVSGGGGGGSIGISVPYIVGLAAGWP